MNIYFGKEKQAGTPCRPITKGDAMTINEATIEVLKKHNLKPYLGYYKDLTLDDLKALGFTMSQLYMDIAGLVNPDWQSLIQTDQVVFDKFWKMIDDCVEGHGYYMLGERHDNPLLIDPDKLVVPTQGTTDAYTLTDRLTEENKQLQEQIIKLEAIRQSYDRLVLQIDSFTHTVCNIIRDGSK